MCLGFRTAKRRQKILKLAFHLQTGTPPRNEITIEEVLNKFKLKSNTNEERRFIDDFDYIAAKSIFRSPQGYMQSSYVLDNKVTEYYLLGGFMKDWWKDLSFKISTFSSLAAIIGIAFGILMGILNFRSSSQIKELQENIQTIENEIQLMHRNSTE
jgi:uncharacterized membrane protein YciS (DUF1049 family)